MEHPFTCIISGPTKSGKTTFVKNLIENKERVIDTELFKIWWCYTEKQPLYNEMRNVTFIEGIPPFDELRKHSPKPQLLILDDLMQETKRSPQLIKYFTRGCHHWNISIIHIVQNLFFEGLRTPRVNSDYIVLFKNPADQLQSQVLARQLYPSKTKYFLEAFTDATKNPHGYLFIDLTQYADDLHRLKTNVFHKTPVIYVPKVINTNSDE